MIDFSGVTDLRRPRRFLTVAAFASAFLSLAYIAIYLRGGPRAPDAAAFWLQGHALSHGLFRWAAPDPTACFRATRLLFTRSGSLAGIEAPGFALALAPAFWVGAPMLVGPLVGAATVFVTWMLARELWAHGPASLRGGGEVAGGVAVGLSVVCAAMRYETADTVPDGLAAVAIALGLTAALRASRLGEPRAFGIAGAAVGAAFATTPASTAPIVIAFAVIALATAREGLRRTNLRWVAMGALPGVLLVLAANHAATGHAFAFPGSVYRAAMALPATHATAKEAASDVLRLVRAHLADVANLEPLVLLVAIPLFGSAASRASRTAVALVAVQLVVDVAIAVRTGNAPPERAALGHVLPIEHALLGVAVVAAMPRFPGRAAILVMALSLAGFALHTSHAHIAAAASGAGHPRFEPDVMREANVTSGLLFFDDDEGYELASDPGVLASHGIQAARMRGDDHDRLLYDLLGHPASHRYVSAAASASVSVWAPPNNGSDTWRFEAEADWPPSQVTGGRAAVVDGAGMCPSDAKALSLAPSGKGDATMVVDLPIPPGPPASASHTWHVIPRVFVQGGTGEGTMTLVAAEDGSPLATWTWKDAANGPGCVEIGEKTVTLGAEVRRAWLVVTARGGAVALDKTVERPR
jgi:hypothetical protein